jgi:hypothetical protein
LCRLGALALEHGNVTWGFGAPLFEYL